MGAETKTGAHPALDVSRPPDELLARDVGRAIAEALYTGFGETAARLLALDSGVVQETLGGHVLDELRRDGIRVTRRGGHL